MTKTLKQFLKPDWRKILMFIILLVFSVIIIPIINARFGLYTFSIGFPLYFYSCTFLVELGPSCTFAGYTYIIIDVLIWYFLSCFITWIYDKFRGKKK
jgi:hypothetical protein